MSEWWRRLFDSSYLKVYDYTRHTTDQDVEFLEEVLGLEPGMRVLDMCCGFGRHAIALAHKDMRVTGVDFSGVLLREARRHARAAGVDVEWIKSDAREFKTRKRYDAVVNLFTAFGYFEDEEQDAAHMEHMARALRRGGLLLIDTMNRDWVTRNFQPHLVTSFKGGHAIDLNRLDCATGRMDVERVLCFDGKTKKQHFSIRLYTGRELALMADGLGLEILDLFGDMERSPLTMQTQRLILVARKPAG